MSNAALARSNGAAPAGAIEAPEPHFGHSGSRWAPPRIRVTDGALESLKWLALVLMTLDHVNKYLLHDRVPALFAAGRLVFPLFAFVFAYNMARPDGRAAERALRAARRLAPAAALATVPFVGLGGLLFGWWPLNILVSFLTAAVVIHLVETGGKTRLAIAVFVFAVGGLIVEFWWPGIAMTLAAWWYLRRPSLTALLFWLFATATLGSIVWLLARVPMAQSLWSLAAFPVIYAVSKVRVNVPRLRWAFYGYYPSHLAVLWLLAEFLR